MVNTSLIGVSIATNGVRGKVNQKKTPARGSNRGLPISRVSEWANGEKSMPITQGAGSVPRRSETQRPDRGAKKSSKTVQSKSGGGHRVLSMPFRLKSAAARSL